MREWCVKGAGAGGRLQPPSRSRPCCGFGLVRARLVESAAEWRWSRSPDYSDSRDGFRLCLGVPRGDTSAKAGHPP